MVKANVWDVLEEMDDITGAALDPQKVVRGREKELWTLKERVVYSYVPRVQAMTDISGNFVKTRAGFRQSRETRGGAGSSRRSSQDVTLGRTSLLGLLPSSLLGRW